MRKINNREKFYLSLATVSILAISSLNATENNTRKVNDLELNKKITADVKKREAIKRLQGMKEIADKTIKIPKEYGYGLYNLLNTPKGEKGFISDETLIKVLVTIRFKRVKKVLPNISISSVIDKNGKDRILIDNKEANKEDIQRLNKNIEKDTKVYLAQKQKNIEKALNIFTTKNSSLLKNSKSINKAKKKGNNTFEIEIRKGEIEKFVNSNIQTIVDISLPSKVRTAMADAMLSTNVDPFALNFSNRNGTDIGVYISEPGCPNTGYLTNYRKFLGTNSNHSEFVSSIINSVAPEARIYCRGGDALPTANDLTTANDDGSPIYIESYSFSRWYENYADTTEDAIAGNASHTNRYRNWDKDWDNEMYEKNKILMVAAGNISWHVQNDTHVSSPAKGFNVITIGNYDDEANPEHILEGTNFGSCFTNPETKINKPEVSAPGTNIFIDNNHNGTGTSMATPHVAGFAANLLEQYSWLQNRPHYFKALLLASSRKNIGGGINKVGVGGVDFYDAVYNSSNIYWTGTFDYRASHDGGTNNSAIERNIYLPAGRVSRVAISWTNSGDYTLDHRTDSHSIAKDYDLSIYDPNGNYIAGSFSWHNSYETIDFTASISGTYKILIHEYKDADSNTPMQLGLAINW